MAKDKSKKKGKEPVVTDEAPATTGGIERVIAKTAKVVQPNWKAFSEYVEQAGGPKINPKHVGIVITGYKYYQKSDMAVSAREEDAQQRAAAKEERDAAREERRQAAEQRKQEAAERKAERDKAAKEKAAKATKTAAKASKPTPRATAGKATATKKAAAKKPAAKSRGKAAF